MRILTVLNNSHDPAGIFGEAILRRGGWYDALLAPEGRLSVDPTREVRIPATPGDYDGLIVLGGLMSADDDAEHPHLVPLMELMRGFVAADRPVLGICLGAQLMAREWGGRCYRMEAPEIGFVPVSATAGASDDRLLSGLDARPYVMQWHQDSFDLPPEAELLMTGEACRNQAFRIGQLAYGLQFHCEATVDMMRQWAMAFAHHADSAPAGFLAGFDAQVQRHQAAARAWTESLAERWIDLVVETRQRRLAA